MTKNATVTRSASKPRGAKRVPARRRKRPSWWLRWGWVIGLVAGAALAGFIVQSARSGSSPVVQPAHAVGAGGAEVKGDAAAPVLVEEYGDFQCPACANWERAVFPTVEQLVTEGKIRFAYYPIAILGPESRTAASAAVCAADEGRFWDYRAYLFANQYPENSGTLTGDYLVDIGAGMGLSSASFEGCVRGSTYQGWIDQVGDQATGRGVFATPTIFVNGVRLSRPPSADELIAAVEGAAS